MKVLILSGGSGTRLFPLSRDRYPKQFLSIFGGKSLLQKTVERALLISGFLEDIIFLSNRNYLNHIRNQVEELFGAYPKHVVLEPVKRNTAPAIVLGLVCMLEKGILKEDEPVLVLPSDHIVSPVDKFIEVVKRAEPVAEEGYMVTFGIKPTRPETGYGYIEADKVCLGSGYRVKLFHEKPTLEKAREYLLAVNFFWNSGMFCFTPRTFFEELRLYCKDIYTQIEGKGFEEIKEGFENMPDISIDYAIMEKTERAVVIPMELYWSDVGSFDAIYEVLEKDENRNGVSGEYVGIDSENNLIITTGKPVATVGITDTIVVSTDDMTVVIKKGQSQQTKELYEIIKQKNRRLTEVHTTDYRPWGTVKLLDDGEHFKINKIIVNPGEGLSLQMHYHRSEHWIVIRGTALIVYEDEKGELKERFIRENESVFIPKTRKHRLINPGKIPLELIEVQVGEYVGEDDIVRFEMDYQKNLEELTG